MTTPTYQDGLRDAARILEYYLFFDGQYHREPGDPAFAPYIDLRRVLYKAENGSTLGFEFDWKPLPARNENDSFHC